MTPKLRLVDDAEKRNKLRKAAESRAEASDMGAAWRSIFSMKNTALDERRLREVYTSMQAGEIERDPADAYNKRGQLKKFSKAEALRLWAKLQERKKKAKLRELVESTPDNYCLVRDYRDLKFMRDILYGADLLAFDCETYGEDGAALDPWRGKIAGFSVSTREHHFYVPVEHADGPRIHTISDYLFDVLEEKPIVMHNAPFDCKWFYVHYGLNLIDNLHADTRIMAMMLDENRSHALKELCKDWLKMPGDSFDELFGNTPFNEIPLEVALVYAAGDTEKTLKLYDWMMQWFDKREDLKRLKKLIFDIEMPVCRHFIWSDLRGINFDIEAAQKLDEQLEKEERTLVEEINKLLGETINLNSPTQLKKKLFEDLGLPDLDNGSTGVRTLKKLKTKHPVIPKILEYREIGKLRQAFTSKLPKEVKSDGKVHPWHNTLGAATGRFTCANPNTQQIPAKRPEVRKLFTAANENRILVSIDYSQIELRVLAHYARDPVLIEAFKKGRDIHSTTASQVFGVPYERIEELKDVDGSKEQMYRKQSKTINFGIVYGMGANKLADTLGISKQEAQEIIEDYFRAYPGIKRFMDEQHRMVMRKGYVVDLFGRKRRLHNEVKSEEKWKVFSAQRMAGNFPIQASAGGILKKAIVNLAPILKRLDVHLLLAVHDEGVFDCPRDISREDLYTIRDTMATAVKLSVPIRCDIEIYPKRWAEKVEEEEWFGGKRNPLN